MSKNSIILSEKHGLNPAMDCCMYCGEAKGIALLGKLPKDEKAPRNIVTSVAPCDKCAEKYKDYVLMVEAKSPDSKKPEPTGRWFAIRKEAINPAYRNSSVAFMLEEDFQHVLNDFNKGE